MQLNELYDLEEKMKEVFVNYEGCLNDRHTREEKVQAVITYMHEEFIDDNEANCIMCGNCFVIGEDGNELGFCTGCSSKPDFPYDLDAYYKAKDAGNEIFKGFETMSRGILEKYRK